MMMLDQNNQTFLSHIQAIINLAIYAICYQNYTDSFVSPKPDAAKQWYILSFFFENWKHFHFMNVSAVM